MIDLSRETEALAARLAAAQRVSVDTVVRRALEAQERATPGTAAPRGRRRMTVDQMTALGAEIAALPLLDRRSPNEIMDDVGTP
jgi:antitoxin VapB